MFVRRSIAGILIACAACAPAIAGETGMFSVGATVLPSRPAVHARQDFPVFASGQQLTTTRFGGSWYVPADMRATAAFYRAQMQQRGYRVLSDEAGENAVRLHWERDGERVEIRLQPVLGTTPATRMIVVANAG